MTRGQDGSLFLSCVELSSTTLCQSPGALVVLFVHVWNRRRLQAFFDDTKTVCMHVYGLPVGASKHARSLDEIRTPRPQQICGSSPKEQPAPETGLRVLVQPVLSSLPKASQTSAGSFYPSRTNVVGRRSIEFAQRVVALEQYGVSLLSSAWITRAFLLASATAARL